MLSLPDLTDSERAAIDDAVLLRREAVGGSLEQAEVEIEKLWTALRARKHDPSELVVEGHLAAEVAWSRPEWLLCRWHSLSSEELSVCCDLIPGRAMTPRAVSAIARMIVARYPGDRRCQRSAVEALLDSDELTGKPLELTLRRAGWLWPPPGD